MKMTEAEATRILQLNFDASAPSFMHDLHERSVFETKRFWELYFAIRLLAERDQKQPSLDRQLTRQIVRISEYIVAQVAHHFNPGDLLRINNLPEDQIALFIERLQAVVDGYVAGYLISEDKFELQPK